MAFNFDEILQKLGAKPNEPIQPTPGGLTGIDELLGPPKQDGKSPLDLLIKFMSMGAK